MNLKWWGEWIRWAQRKAIAIAHSGDFLGLTVFLGELGQVFECLVTPFAGLSEVVGGKGGFLKKAQNLLAWAAAHPDPMGNARDYMRAMETKWGPAALPAGPRTPPADPPKPPEV